MSSTVPLSMDANDGHGSQPLPAALSCALLLSELKAECEAMAEVHAKSDTGKSNQDSTGALEEAKVAMEAQKEAMEREHEELVDHWEAIRADYILKVEGEEIREAEVSIMISQLQEAHGALAIATYDLREKQEEAREELVVRNQMQSYAQTCVDMFREAQSAQQQESDSMTEERAKLRQRAVDVGQELQAAVSKCDELLAENAHLHSECSAAGLQKASLDQTHERSSRVGLEISTLCAHLHRRINAVSASRALFEPCSIASPRGERQELIENLARQNRQLLLLQQAGQCLSGDAYVDVFEPDDRLSEAVRAAFLELNLGVAPPLVRLRGSPGEDSQPGLLRDNFLFQTSLVEAYLPPSHDGRLTDVRFRLVPPNCALPREASNADPQAADAPDGLWMTAAQLICAVGWKPSRARSPRKFPSAGG